MMNSGLVGGQQWGVLRSFLIYYAIPGRLRRLQRFYSQFMRPGDLCFDVGAHVGNRTLAWRRLGADVVAVEPQPHILRWLQRLYGRSPHIHLVGAAVGAQVGQQTLYVSQKNPTVTTLSAPWITAVQREESFAGVEWETAVPVPVTTLDALIAQYGRPAFTKIDVEGYEAEALRGLSQALPALSFEFLPAAGDVAHDCLAQLARLGDYAFNWSLGESHRWQSEGWLTAAAMSRRLTDLTRQPASGDIYARLRR